MRRACLGLLLAAACGTAPEPASRMLTPLAVEPSDVAILYPLPGASAEGVIPRDVFGHLGALVPGQTQDETYGQLRVVAVRLEPCFVADAVRGGACERQVRFVLQPVTAGTTLDAAVHAIYTLSDDAFEALSSGIVRARGSSASGATLGVHPLLAAEGPSGSFARALDGELGRARAAGQLERVTFVGVRGRGNEWQFGGLRIDARGAVTVLPIPTSAARLQSLVVQRSGSAFAKSVSALATGNDELPLLFDTEGARAASPEHRAAALRAANRVENPDTRSSEDTDCATCHTVASSRLWAEQTFGVREDVDRFVAGVPSGTGGTMLADPGMVRALGYFGTEAVVSPRAANDTWKAVLTMRAGAPTERRP